MGVGDDWSLSYREVGPWYSPIVGISSFVGVVGMGAVWVTTPAYVGFCGWFGGARVGALLGSTVGVND